MRAYIAVTVTFTRIQKFALDGCAALVFTDRSFNKLGLFLPVFDLQVDNQGSFSHRSVYERGRLDTLLKQKREQWCTATR
jgi:hypothetical protein